MDTEGKPLPEGVSAFAAHGAIDQIVLERFAKLPVRSALVRIEVCTQLNGFSAGAGVQKWAGAEKKTL